MISEHNAYLWIKGLVDKFDPHINEILNDNLFERLNKKDKNNKFSLKALKIARGRDDGNNINILI